MIIDKFNDFLSSFNRFPSKVSFKYDLIYLFITFESFKLTSNNNAVALEGVTSKAYANALIFSYVPCLNQL